MIPEDDGPHQPAANNKTLRPRGRPKMASDDDRRTEIIDCARRTFVELGFAGTTTDIVAARCKISKQTLYRLFSSKSDLFKAVIIAHRQMMLDLPRPSGEDLSFGETLGKIFLLDIDEDMERERKEFIHLVQREAEALPEMSELLYTEGALRSRENLTKWLGEQRDKYHLVLDDPASGARMLMDAIFGGMGRQRLSKREHRTRDERRQHLQNCLDIFVRGTRADDALEKARNL